MPLRNGASMAAFDQSRDDRAAERERCLRRRDQSIVVLTAEARSPRQDGGIAHSVKLRTPHPSK